MAGVSGQRHDRIVAELGSGVAIQLESTADGGSNDFEISVVQKMLSAVTGSILTSLLVTPLDVVRIRLQSQSQYQPRFRSISSLPSGAFNNLPSNLGVTACCREVFWVNNNAHFCVVENQHSSSLASTTTATECAAEQTQRKTFTSTFDGLRKISRNEGFTTLWRGLSPTLVMAVPANVIYFSGYDWLRTSQSSPLHNRVNELYAPLIAGSSARVLAAVAVGPIELFRTRMQAGHGESAASNFQETLRGINQMVASQGYRSLWRGLTLTIWRDVPFSAFYWWGYEAIRNSISRRRDRSRDELSVAGASIVRARSQSRGQADSLTTLIDSFAAGAISGAISSILTMPFDVGKTRQQVFHHSRNSLTSSSRTKTAAPTLQPEEQSMPRLLWHIFKEEGASGLFKGWVARTLKVAPACAIMISTYEVGKKLAKDMSQEGKRT